jgi:hypothetical protein
MGSISTKPLMHIIINRNRANRDQSSQEAFFFFYVYLTHAKKVVKHTSNLPIAINIKFGVAVGALPNCD